MVHIFKIPEGARNVKSFIEEQTVLTVEDFERGEGTLRVAFHHHEVSLEQLVAFQAAIDAEYLVERPGEPTDRGETVPCRNTTESTMRKVKVVIHSFEEGIDVFTLGAYGFEPEHEVQDPDYCKDAPDFDDFEVPGIVLPALIGEYGEPSELVGRVFEIKLP